MAARTLIELEDQERSKYEKVWENRDYRKVSPGELVVHEFLELSEGSVLDIGCGTGRAAQRIKNAGREVTGFDIACNCLDTEVDIPLVLGCVWSDTLPEADWGFCTDVMEHIPEKRVHDAVANIAKSCKNVYFRVYMHPDNGKFSDEPLHLTCKPATYWFSVISEYWNNVSCTDNGTVVTIIGKNDA